MIRLALRSALHHRGGLLATGLVAMVGAALVAAMAGILATGLAATTPATDRPFLVQFPVILGGWILCIVLFAVVSTVGVTLGGRVGEIGWLQLLGASPGQMQRMVAVETSATALVAAVPGTAAGYLLGGVVVSRAVATGVVSGDGGYAPGLLLPVGAAAVVVLASAVGAVVGSRAIARRSAVAGPASARDHRSGGTRRVVALVLVVVGLASSSTSLAMPADSVYATAATGPGCVLVAVGLSLLASELIRLADLVLRQRKSPSNGPSGWLAAINLSSAPERIRPAVTFLTLFVGVSAGTLSMQSIENRVSGSTGGTGALLASINYLVVALVAAFMTIALVNSLVAVIGQRVGELAVMSSVGATRDQAVGMLVRESTVAVVLGSVAGGSGAVVTVVPFAVVKSGSALAALEPVALVATLMAGAVVLLGTTVIAGRRVTGRPVPVG